MLKPKLLDAAAVSALSRLIYWVLQPCFLLCSVASTQGASVSQRGGARFYNVYDLWNPGPLPMIFANALFAGSLLTDVTACVCFSLLRWSPLFWSAGRMILGSAYNQVGDSEKKGMTKVVMEIGKWLRPLVLGSILGVIIGGTGWIRNACLSPRGLAAPLFGACNTLGSAYLSAVVLVLPGRLVQNPIKETNKASTRTKAASSVFTKKVVVSIMFSRFCLAPLLPLATMWAFEVRGLLPFGRAKAVVTFTLLMEGCMPPSQNSVIMYQLDSLTELSEKMAKTLALIYTMAVLPVTFF
jgi:predicted permease